MIDIGGLAASLLIVSAVAAFGSQFMPGLWYEGIAKPAWTPPGWIFGPVWTMLYVLMALAAWLVWREGREGRRNAALLALGVYAAQLLANALWSWIFFGLHRIGLALLDLGILWILIAVSCLLFWSLRSAAGILMLPYLAWVSFAGVLNFTLWRLNA
ncbi:MAG: tryptophan-rich sensory protein [Deltaproteobacteria bacterium]|nr:tryptophan-rich sensory protein [Deltaproteobacteria bacterium]